MAKKEKINVRVITLAVHVVILLYLPIALDAQPLQPVRIHYGGGGDWYGNKTTWMNILNKARNDLGLQTTKRETAAKILDADFVQYPMAYIAGHGNIVFSEEEAAALRLYLESGGFLWADDDYGMDKSFRREMKKVFPELNFVELPFSHPIYHVYYQFNNGLPKVHEHAGGPPKGLGLIFEGRLVCFYSFNTDISDGCEDAQIHNDPPEVRRSALKMAVNILLYALLN
ncbi:MAG TPA: DUF4159 domain-containing protein [Caldithrix abyssi]|uniref:DUF4159 domain-containing protein n=1 Tax=Caldithrix abyssi TaxID=187145 RepID=A0A7V4U245_CALAY|nr:DUF4159 domain-containing protein [Caldithrix abyssi]